jgi:hypothetical protein
MKLRHTIAFLALTALGGCGTTLSGLAVSLTSPSPTQVKTLAEAIQATTTAENSLDVIVNSGVVNQATLAEIKKLVTDVHTELKKFEAANSAGNSVAVQAEVDAFNAALSALNGYKTLQGVS